MKLIFPESQSGISIIEALLASAIVVIGATGFGVAFQRIERSRLKMLAVTSALGAESALQSKLQDKNTFTGIATDLAAGNVTTLSSLTIPVEIPVAGGVKTPNLTVGQDLYFDKEVNLCSSCNTGTNWLFRLRIEAQKKSGTAFPVYALAYRFDFNPELISMPSIGSLNASGFTITDFKWAVPPEAYLNTTLVPCDPSNHEVFITGMNKVTGQAYCIQVADSVTCGSNQVADGWRIVSGHLQIHCKNLATATTPAAPYVVQNFNAKLADSTLSGTAVPVTDSPWPLQTASGFTVPYTGRSVAGPVCPPNYHFVGNCTAVSVTSWPGYVNVGCPAGQTGGPVWSAVMPTGVGNITNTSSGQNLNCDLTNPSQPTGSGYDAGWDANIQVSGSCVSNLPAPVSL